MEPLPDQAATAVADGRLAALFPEEHATRRRRLWLPVLVVLVAVIVALVTTDAFGSDEPGFRTATVATRTVETTVQGVASIEPVSQSAVAFPVAGTVATVIVAPGQTVALGQVLATLDAQQLQATLHEKELALAQAQLALTNAMDGNASGPASSGGNGNGSTRSAATTAVTSGAPRIVLTAAPLGAPASIGAAQQAVVQAQHDVDQALAAAAAAEAAARSTCAAAGVSTGPAPGPPSTTTSTTSTTTPSGADLAACQAALADLLRAQQAVASAQHALTAAEHTLDALLAQEAASAASGARSGSSGTTSGSRSTTTPSGPSAADLASYQQAVDSAAAGVAVAEQAVNQGTIVSPIAGTVSAVNLTVGQSVSAASTSANVIVTGAGGFEVSTNLTVTEVPHVSPGAVARVVPDGAHRSYRGKVVSISALPSSVTTSATNYLVVVGLDDPGAPLTNGDLGTVTIVTKRVADVLSVPTSAVTVVGTRHLVQVLGSGGSPKTVSVRVGAVGSAWTQVTSGLRAGDTVVVADLSTPLPGSATSSTNGTTGTTGGAAGRIQSLFRGAGAGGGFGGFGGAAGGGGAGR